MAHAHAVLTGQLGVVLVTVGPGVTNCVTAIANAQLERVTDPDQLRPALEQAFANAPALIDVVLTRDALSSDAAKGMGSIPDYQALLAWDEAERRRRGEPVA